MKFSIATVFPQLYENFLDTSLLKRAQEKAAVSFDVVGFSSFCAPKERLDGPVAGHGSGMAIRPEVVQKIVEHQEAQHGKAFKIFVTPQGKKLDQRLVHTLSEIFAKQEHVMFFAGRYEGIDERAQSYYADLEVSVGDYVLMGGDLPVMIILESVMRYIPGVVGKTESVESDSFTGPFVDYPTYTVPPREWNGLSIPEVILSGNHAAMNEYRQDVAIKKSVINHFEWVRSRCVTDKDRKKVAKVLPHHYVALMHDDVFLTEEKVGTSSVTSLDIHDIARSSKTYGIKEYFLVTSLVDQQRIVAKFLQFWHEGGVEYNKNRSDAIKLVSVKSSFDEVIDAIEKKEGKRPLVIATSACNNGHNAVITYKDQERVWQQERPVLFIFGTAKGLSNELIARCDYLLLPIEGFSYFNHLSVRSAVAIILDRWLGINLL